MLPGPTPGALEPRLRIGRYRLAGQITLDVLGHRSGTLITRFFAVRHRLHADRIQGPWNFWIELPRWRRRRMPSQLEQVGKIGSLAGPLARENLVQSGPE